MGVSNVRRFGSGALTAGLVVIVVEMITVGLVRVSRVGDDAAAVDRNRPATVDVDPGEPADVDAFPAVALVNVRTGEASPLPASSAHGDEVARERY